jgi:hypothetical protein
MSYICKDIYVCGALMFDSLRIKPKERKDKVRLSPSALNWTPC